MATSHIRSITGNTIKFIKTKLSFFASNICLLFSKPQAATSTSTTHVGELNESQVEHISIEGMTTFPSPNIKEASVQVKRKNKIHRSRFDTYVNLYQHKQRRKRSRAVSRIPTTQIKRVLQKSKKVIIKVQKDVRKVVPHSSKLHAYLSRKSSAYHRLNNEFVPISDHKHKSATKQRLNFNKKDYQSKYHCFTKQQSLFLLFVQTRTPKHKKSVAFIYTDEHGLKKLQCSCVQVLWVAHHRITISGDVKKNHGPFTQTNNDKSVPCTKSVNSVSLLELRLAELGRVPVNVLGDGNCFFRAVSYQLYNTPEYHLYKCFLGILHLQHYPELYTESNYEQSWQYYVHNMPRQGTWADNIIIQAVANSLNVTINIIESNANFSPVTVINPVNTYGQTTNIYIGHIQEYHYVSTTSALSSPEITRDSGLIQKSVSSHEDKVEQYKESHFSQKKQSQFANAEEDNRKGANISEAGIDSDTDMEPKKKIENHKTTKREFKQKKRAQAVNPNRLKLSEVDKAEKRKASKRKYIRKKRAQTVNPKRLKLSEVDKVEKRKASKRECIRKKRAQAVNPK